VVRFFILRAHYRSPLNYSDVHLDDAKGALTRLYTALRDVPPSLPIDAIKIDWNIPVAKAFKSAMDDDFNTPEAMAVLQGLAKEINISKSRDAANLMLALGGVLGLLQQHPIRFLQGSERIITNLHVPMPTLEARAETFEVDALIKARAAAKKAKNYAEADRIRKELLEAGIVLEDSAAGTTWRRA
jgi:cysteinyl-tRNA synthetase